MLLRYVLSLVARSAEYFETPCQRYWKLIDAQKWDEATTMLRDTPGLQKALEREVMMDIGRELGNSNQTETNK